MKARFKKGQKVYRAASNISSVNKSGQHFNLCMVIERTVDSCGAKRMTFEDDGNDFVFGKSVCLTSIPVTYFATPEEAFEYLKSLNHPSVTYEINNELFSDKSNKWFEVAKQWKLERKRD